MEHPLKRDVSLQIVKRSGLKLSPKDFLFKEQEAFHDDPSTIKAAQTTRRAGKSVTGGSILFTGAETPQSMNPYIALTRDSAKRIIWPVLVQLNRKLGSPGIPVESALTIKFPQRNSEIFCVGADQKNFIERLRGIKIKQSVLDEVGSFKSHIGELVDDVLEPACLDFRGQISLLGTPGVRPMGYFYDITTGKQQVPLHRWSLYDNPYLPNARAYVESLIKRKGWTELNPTYRREYCGEWVLDLDALVYKFHAKKNVFKGFSKEEEEWPWYTVMGIDYGYSPDPTSFVVLKYSPESPKIFIIHAEKHLELTPSDIGEKTNELIAKFAPTNIVADSGALGKSITAELTKRFGIPVKPAEKKEKLANQQLMNGDFIDGKLFVHESLEDLIHQYSVLTYADNGQEDPSLPNDLCDAALYAWRECHAYAFQPKVPQISPNSDQFMSEYWKKEEERIEREDSGAEIPGENW